MDKGDSIGNRGENISDSLSTLEAFDDFCFSTLDLFLEKHGLPVLRARLLSSFVGELESIQVLREFWFEYLEGSHEKLIEIYERANDRKKVPHYENLIDLFLVSFFAELLAALIAVEYSKNHEAIKKTIEKMYVKSRGKIRTVIQRVSDKYGRFLEFLFRVYILKEYFERKGVTLYSDFVLFREKIRNNTILRKKPFKKLPEDYQEFEKSFLRKHSLPSAKKGFSEELGNELLSLSTVSRQKPKTKEMFYSGKPDRFSVNENHLKATIDGTVTVSGFAAGKVKVVLNEADCYKVEKGDIIVLVESQPGFIPAVVLAGALVADKSGLTGHVTIQGRELGKPTIVRTEMGTKVLKDGMNVFVDAVQGIIYEIIS